MNSNEERKSPLISLKSVCKYYGQTVALDKITLDVNAGEFLTVVGSSGCGKTTILKLINGISEPDSGSVMVDGVDISGADKIALRRGIGYCIQGSVLFPHLTVAENVAFVPHLRGKKDDRKLIETIKHCISIVGIEPELGDRYPAEISGGQQQRVGIARALASDGKILLMDEPFGAVDSITRAQLQEQIKDIHKRTGITVIFITHDIREALYLGTKVLVLDKGKIEQIGAPQKILREPATQFVRQLLRYGIFVEEELSLEEKR